MRKLLMAAVGLVFVVGCGGSTKPYEQRAAEIQKAQEGNRPFVISKVDGVTLYRVLDKDANQTVYFTAPSGSVQWTVPGTDDTPAKQFNVTGKTK